MKNLLKLSLVIVSIFLFFGCSNQDDNFVKESKNITIKDAINSLLLDQSKRDVYATLKGGTYPGVIVSEVPSITDGLLGLKISLADSKNQKFAVILYSGKNYTVNKRVIIAFSNDSRLTFKGAKLSSTNINLYGYEAYPGLPRFLRLLYSRRPGGTSWAFKGKSLKFIIYPSSISDELLDTLAESYIPK